MKWNWFTVFWFLVIPLEFAIVEGWALAHDHKDTLSQNLQRAFAEHPYWFLMAFFMFVGWFTVHIWASLIVHVAKATKVAAVKLKGKAKR